MWTFLLVTFVTFWHNTRNFQEKISGNTGSRTSAAWAQLNTDKYSIAFISKMCDFVEMKTISNMADGVLSKLTKEYSRDKKITQDVLTELRPVFGEIIFESLELLEWKDGITEIHSNTSKRTMFNVRGHGPIFDVNYIILPASWRWDALIRTGFTMHWR